MAKANAAMAAMGATNDPRKVAQTMQEFQKESAKMDMGQEMMDDTLDGVFDDDEVEGETDDLMNQASLPFSLDLRKSIVHQPRAGDTHLCKCGPNDVGTEHEPGMPALVDGPALPPMQDSR